MKDSSVLRFLSYLALAGAIAIVAFNLYSVRNNLQAQIDYLYSSASLQLEQIEKRVQSLTGEYTETNKVVGAAGTEVPTIVALFSTSLASAISSSATSMTLVSATDKDGNTLASSTYPFIIDEGTASEELVIADCTSTACTNMIRGVSVLTGTSSVTALKKSHRRGASVKITDGPQLMILSRMLNGIGKLPNVISYLSHPTFSSGTQLVDKTYADSIAIAGGATSTESTAGISKLATQLKMASSTFDSTDPTVIYSLYSTSTPSAVCGLCVPITQNNGKLHQSFLDLTQTYNFSGLLTLSGGFIATASSTFTNATTSFNGVAYGYPSSISTTTQTMQFFTDNQISYGRADGALIASTTLTAGAATTTLAIPNAGTDLHIVIEIPASSGNSGVQIQFNGDTGANYAYGIAFGGSADVSEDGIGDIALTTEQTAAGFLFSLDVTNQIAQRKLVTFTGGRMGSGASYAVSYDGGGVWNNTTARIQSISVGCGLAAATCSAGTRISVYSSRY